MSTDVSPVSAPTVEIGYARSGGGWWSDLEEESTPELRWPLSVEVSDRMRRQDAQVGSVLRAVSLPVRRTTWRLDPDFASDVVTETIAEDLGLPILGDSARRRPPVRGRDRFSWSEHLRMALLMLPIGHAFFEQVCRFDDRGLARLRKLAWRPHRTISAINVAPDGGLVSIEQHPPARLWTDPASRGWAERRPIPVKWLTAYVLDREGGNWAGNSILRPAYKNWLIKDRLLRVQAQTIERNGMGVPRYTGAEGEEDLTKGLALAQSWRSGESAGAAIPYGSKLDLAGVQGVLPDANPAIRYQDEQIARAVLAHFLNLGTQTGSWALGSTFEDFFTLSLQTVGEQVADVATHHIVEDLVDLNFGPDEPAPRIVFDEIGSRRDATADAIKVLVDAGVIRTDSDLEEFVRTSFGLPSSKPGAPAPTGTETP